MKKILVLLTVLLVMGLGACASSPDTLDERVIDLENEVLTLQEELDLLEARFDNLVVSTGLNGQVDYYENDSYVSTEQITMSLLAYEQLVKETDYLIKANFPDYIWDDNDNYITVNDLGNLLTQKYFGISSETTIGFQYRMTVYKPADMDYGDYITRLSMMIMELSHYDFYTIDSPELYIIVSEGASQHVKVRMSLLVSDKYDLHPAIFWSEMMDTDIKGFSYDESQVQALYDDYMLNLTFDGFVLTNYK
jgi:hypothetical protein